MNRLARERSPYLLQHADNPVDWYPWGDEAFDKAQAREQADLSVDRLLDLPLVPRDGARVVRERGGRRRCSTSDFVSIKVDREERPDVDRVYMTFVQATTGSGGWPMSVWLTPELKPFYGGTYFPPTSKWGRPGLRRHPAARSRASGQHDRAQASTSRPRSCSTGCSCGGWSRRPVAGRIDRRRRRRAGRSGRAVPAGVRSAPRRLRRRAEVSAAVASCCSCCASTRGPATQPRADDGAARRCARWRSAACAITSAAASTATRWTATGACRTSRRCSTTRRSSCWRTSKRRRRPAIAFYRRRSPRTRCATCCAR